MKIKKREEIEMMKLKPKTMTKEQLSKVADVAARQTGYQARKKTTDGSEVFKVPINSSVLVYVPNHNEVIDGVEQLVMDKPFLHLIRKGNSVQYVRCTADAEELGYSSCPMCENAQYHWDLANYQVEEACKSQGLDPSDKKNPDVQAIRSKYYQSRVLDSANRRYTFPIVVINTKEKDEDGNPVVTPMWYSISERFYRKSWGIALKAIENGNKEMDLGKSESEDVDDENTVFISPGGRFFELDYTYDAKGGQPNRMQSALNLKVFHKKVGSKWNYLKEKMDEMTKDWDVARSSSVVVDNLFYEEEDMRALAEELTEPVKQRIDLYETKIPTSAPAINVAEVKSLGNKAEPEALEIDDELEII